MIYIIHNEYISTNSAQNNCDMKAIIIVNSSSGKGRPERKLSIVMSKLLTIYSDIVICRTYHRQDAYRYTYNNLPNCDLVVVIGGDGTINDVINAISSTNYNPIVAIVPNGTCNDVAHSLNLPHNPSVIADLIIAKSITKTDILQINDKFATYGIALGKFASTSFVTKQSTKKCFGKISYIFNAAKDMFAKNHLPLNINVDGTNVSGDYCLLLISNSKFVAGFQIDPNANISDGKAKLILVPASGRIRDSLLISKIFLSGLTHLSQRDTFIYDFGHIYAKLPHTMNLVVDGEKYITDYIDISVLPQRIRFVCKNTSTK